MNSFKKIQIKLEGFIRKYYTNEIIKGSILFLSFGLVYFIFTLFIEYFLWLRPLARSILFWCFIFVELGLLIRFIIIPLLKLIGLQKGISLREASGIIGKHFHEIDDKLLNVLQLKESKAETDLLLASIEQKADKLQPVPFKKAIDFKTNLEYIKYLAIPVLIVFIVFITGNQSIFTQSLDRVVHHKIAYNPPAPFYFKILNKSLKAVEGKAFSLKVITEGDMHPEDIKIYFEKESYYLSKRQNNIFTYEFEYPDKNLSFYLESNGLRSQVYDLEVLSTPKVISFEMLLNYPEHTHKENMIHRNTGNTTLPEGTTINWIISTQHTSNVNFKILNQSKNRIHIKPEPLKKAEDGQFEISNRIMHSFDYQINTSNAQLKNYEKLNFHLQVIRDEYPKIVVKSDIDSVSRGPVQFKGQISDDYGISKLQVVAKSLNNSSLNVYNIQIDNSDFMEFFYVFPEGMSLKEGSNYEIYFEVFDNDGVNGRKKVISETFYYKNKTDKEIEEELLIEQKETLKEFQNSTKDSEEFIKAMDEFSNKLKSKNKRDWNDKKQLEKFLERQKKYQKILEQNTDKLLNNLEDMDEENDHILENKKEDLKDRIEEAKELQKKQDLLKELMELADKLKKEDLLNKIDKLKQQSKQEARSLERILELTKRFYIEKKAAQIVNKLDELSVDQKNLSKEELNSFDQQDQLNKRFDSIQKDLEDLNVQNKDLKEPMSLPETGSDEKLIEMEMRKALKNLESVEEPKEQGSDKIKKAIKNQNSSSMKIKELSKKLKNSFIQMEMEGVEENIKDLQQILDNLVIFSFDQEELMLSFKDVTAKNADYPEKLKHQHVLKEHFEHIDDSLYTLSLRMVKLSSKIQKDLTDAHYNLDRSLENIAENKIDLGMTNQQYTMTAANNLADLLSDILQSLQNKKPGSGKGKGKKGEELSLPDIIKRQGELIKKLKQGTNPGKNREGKSKEQMSGEQFMIYQEQNQLRNELNELLRKEPAHGSDGKKILKKMEDLEKMLLEKGISNEAIQNMQKLEYELLKLESADVQQNKDDKRKAETSNDMFMKRNIEPVQNQQIYFNQNEILNRQNLPLKPLYQSKVKLYFKQN